MTDNESDLVNTLMYLVTYMCDVTDEARALFLQAGFLDVGFHLLDYSNSSEAIDDPSEVELSFIMASTKVAQFQFTKDNYQKLRKLFKYLLHKVVEIYNADLSSIQHPEEFYESLCIEQCLDVMDAICAIIECGDQTAVNDILSHSESDRFITLIVQVIEVKVY